MSIVQEYLTHHLYWFTSLIILPGVALFLMSLTMRYQAIVQMLMPQRDGDYLITCHAIDYRRLKCLSLAIKLLHIAAIAFCGASLIDVVLIFWVNEFFIVSGILITTFSIFLTAVGLCYAMGDVLIIGKNCKPE